MGKRVKSTKEKLMKNQLIKGTKKLALSWTEESNKNKIAERTENRQKEKEMKRV